MRCPNCNTRISSRDEFCPMCDYILKKKTVNTDDVLDGVDPSLHDDYDTLKRRTYTSNGTKFEIRRSRHIDETPAERYSCEGEDSHHSTYKKPKVKTIETKTTVTRTYNGKEYNYKKPFNTGGRLFLGFITFPVCGMISFLFIIFTIIASNAHSSGNMSQFTTMKRVSDILKVILIIITVLMIVAFVGVFLLEDLYYYF